ncbi:MAG: iron uptake system protein EfeO [Streptosporangiales bacterium]|nr:iron uptake system protein EfeO [Streptosporangiales bacterium]
MPPALGRRPRTALRGPAAIGTVSLVTALAAACGGSGGAAEGAGAVPVNASDTTCQVGKTALSAGTTHFAITNEGTQVTEVYVYAPGDRIVTERENIGPGTKAELTVELAAGKYQVACKPGMKGRGIRTDITVTGTAQGTSDARLTRAVADYRAYVQGQADEHLPLVEDFVAAVKDGDVAKAKDLYAKSRVGWERVEPVAESFGDLDPKLDIREADLEEGQKFTGWHRLEKALWETGEVKGEAKTADTLLADYKDFQAKVKTAQITPTSMANGAKELLDEVATGKVTGEEEAFSHTDLVDFKANVDGAQKVYGLLEPVVKEKDAALATRLSGEFADVQKLLEKYEKGDGYVSYDTVGESDRKELSDAVNALAEPLSKLAKTVVS